MIGRSGPLAALTSGLPKQQITSHPSIKGRLDKGAPPPHAFGAICHSPEVQISITGKRVL